MSDPVPSAVSRARQRWRSRFGLRFLLAIILLAALVFGWVASEHRRATEQTALVAQLAGVGVRPILEEPTGFGLLVRKFIPDHERGLRERIGSGWFLRPTVFVCAKFEDEKALYAAERLRRLGTVREVHIQRPRLGPKGISELRAGLPGVDVVPAGNPALNRYFQSQVRHEHLAIEGLLLLGLILVGVFGILILVAWPFWSRRRTNAVGSDKVVNGSDPGFDEKVA